MPVVKFVDRPAQTETLSQVACCGLLDIVDEKRCGKLLNMSELNLSVIINRARKSVFKSFKNVSCSRSPVASYNLGDFHEFRSLGWKKGFYFNNGKKTTEGVIERTLTFRPI